ncbi:MAG: glycosyltransferase family 2 protein [Chloroflexi bacterium]|nr:glycosyltransferase family 2 protein [Chloroflexota bacterium]
MSSSIFCSTIIPTIGRETLQRAITSVLEQRLAAANFEIIVVNDSGKPLLDGDWRGDRRVQVIATCCRERSVARNTGAAVARGQYLHFLDDDDWMLPGAFEHFWQLAQRAPHAAWLYGGSQLVNRQSRVQ